MTYLTDRPINTADNDLLGRANFSRQLGKSICEYNGTEGLVIGLFGKWGTGKTSIINMAIGEIEHQTRNDKNKPLIIHFSPWNYSDNNNLIGLFFKSLENKVNLKGYERLKNLTGSALQNYSWVIDGLALVSIDGASTLMLIKFIFKVIKAKFTKKTSLDEAKKKLELALRISDNKIIVIIDDIDRLTNSQIRDIFQLVKQVGDFSNIIYVLVMDREVVCRALNKVHGIDGKKYLEKIIQVPFEIPEINKLNLQKIFLTNIKEVFVEFSKDTIDQDYWAEVFRNCIEPYIKTLRDVSRVVNAFRFRYGILYKETSFEDMVAITVIEVLEPALYKWISHNKDRVCRTSLHSLLSINSNNQNSHELYFEEFTNLKLDPKITINFLTTIFPAFAADINKEGYYYGDEQSIRRNKRVANEKKFELYFMYNLDDIKISRSTIEDCIFKFDLEDLSKIIEEIDQQGNSQYFLDELDSFIENIPEERLVLIASVLLRKKNGFQGEDFSQFYMISAHDTAETLIIRIIRKIERAEKRYELIYSAVNKVSESNLGTIASIINNIEISYSRVREESQSVESLIINYDQLKRIEKDYIAKINNIIKDHQIFDLYKGNIAFNVWLYLDKNNAEGYLNNILKSDINILKFICSIASRWNGTDGCGWDFNLDRYSSFITKEKIFNIIQEFNKTELCKFSKINQIKLASFVLNYDKNDWERINEVDAQKLVEKWNAIV